MSCLSQELTDKLEYACQAYIKELLNIQNEEKQSNKETYSWLDNADYQNEVNSIQYVIEEMFAQRLETENIMSSIISDYFVPEDVHVLRRFSDNYYVHVCGRTQDECEIAWKRRTNNSAEYSTQICELGMYFYMELHKKFVVDNLYELDTSIQLK